jgi:hypothetical protein
MEQVVVVKEPVAVLLVELEAAPLVLVEKLVEVWALLVQVVD